MLVASAILATALFGLAAFQVNLHRWQEDMVQRKVALMLANDQMQVFRNYTSLSPTSGQFSYDDIINGATSVTTDQTTYTVTSNVINTDAQVNNDINTNLPLRKTVSITVTWTNYSGKTSSINLSGTIARINPIAAGEVSREMYYIE